MSEAKRSAPGWMFWVGWTLTVLPALMLLGSAAGKLAQAKPVVEGLTKAGYNPDVLLGLGIVELVCTVLYLIPQTSVLGAVLLTGYLGGATATHLRVGEPYFGPVMVGVVLWLGLYFRCGRVRALLPLRL